jgi:hypothetical protein
MTDRIYLVADDATPGGCQRECRRFESIHPLSSQNIGSRIPTRHVDIDDPQRFSARLRRYDEARMILHRHWPRDETHPSAGRFCDSGPGELASNWSVTDKDGSPIKIDTGG